MICGARSVSLPVSIVDIALGSPDHAILVEAVVFVGLAETLESEGPFTLFAPTNEAFANLLVALEANTLEDLGEDLVRDVLLYHAVAAKAMSGDLVSSVVETVLGEELCVAVNNNGVMVNNVPVATADLEATNGVVHVIETGMYFIPWVNRNDL